MKCNWISVSFTKGPINTNMEGFKQFFEMAQSFDVRPDTRLEMDKFDKAFVQQLVAQGVPEGAALRARYTTLIQDQVPDGGQVRVSMGGRIGERPFTVKKTYLPELMQKLRTLRLPKTMKHGMADFNRQDAVNMRDRGFLSLDYQARRNEKARGLDYQTYGKAGSMSRLNYHMNKLPLSDAVREYWAQNSDAVKKAVDTGIAWAIGSCYDGEDRDQIYKTVLADVLLNGEKPDRDNPDAPVITRPNWITWRVRGAATALMRKLHGSDWKQVCFAA